MSIKFQVLISLLLLIIILPTAGVKANGYAFSTDKSIKIDGDLSDWPDDIKQFPFRVDQPDQIALGKEQFIGADDFSSIFYVTWDAQFLYIGVNVKDDVLCFADSSSRDYYRSDSVRFYLDTKEKAFAFVILPKGPEGKLRWRLGPYDGFEQEISVEAVKAAADIRSDGYSVEFAVELNSLGLDPEQQAEVGFQVLFSDSDVPDVRSHEFTWYPPRGKYWDDRATFGKLSFVHDFYIGLQDLPKQLLIGEPFVINMKIASREEKAPITVSYSLKGRDGIALQDADKLSVFVGAHDTKIILATNNLAMGAYTLVAEIEADDKFIPIGEKDIIITKKLSELSRLKNIADNLELSAMLNPKKGEILPSVKNNIYTNRVEKVGNDYIFIYDGPDLKVSYNYRPHTATMSDVLVYINDILFFRPNKNSGPVFFIEGRQYRLDEVAVNVNEVRTQEDRLYVVYEIGIQERRYQLEYQISIRGKTLIVETTAQDPIVSSFDGGLSSVGNEFFIPYLTWVKFYDLSDMFVAGFFDWRSTNASRMESDGPKVIYNPKTNGEFNLLKERYYLTVSNNIQELFPNIPNPVSDYKEELGRTVILDSWLMWEGKFKARTDYLKLLKSYGVDNLALIIHPWQKHGFDNGFPDVVPAYADFGGDEELIEVGRTAKELGFRLALHENYQDYYPNADGYDERNISLTSSGDKMPAWFNQKTGLQSWRTKPTRIPEIAKMYSPRIHSTYFTSGSFHDAGPGVRLPYVWDYDVNETDAGKLKSTYEMGIWLYDYLSTTHRGPIFGEGTEHVIWSGIVDGFEAEVYNGTENRGRLVPIIPDFYLLKVNPLASNHGMGYYERWRSMSYNWQLFSEEEEDEYRLMQIAYGNSGFIPNVLMPELSLALREYHLIQPLQIFYMLSDVSMINYEIDGELVDINEAIRKRNFERVNICYENGLEIWLNRKADAWVIGEYFIPQYGFLAMGPGILAYTALANKESAKRVSYCETNHEVYADPRNYLAKNSGVMVWSPSNSFINFGKIATDGTVKCYKYDNEFIVMPIPHGALIQLEVDLAQIYGRKVKVKRIVIWDETHAQIGELPIVQNKDRLRMELYNSRAHYYKVELDYE